MPYDLHTPFGITPGQVSPAEQMQAQAAARLGAAAAADDARNAQLQFLKQSQQSKDGNDNDPGFHFFEDKPAPTTVFAPDRQFMAQRQDVTGTKWAGDSTADLAGDRQFNEARNQGAMQQMQRQQALGSEFDRELGLPGAGGQPGAGPVNPNAQPGQDYSSLVGPGSGGQSPGGLSSEDQMMRLAILGSAANGGAMPNIGDMYAKRAEMQMAGGLNALKMKQLEAEMSDQEFKRQKDREDQAKLDRGEPVAPRGYAELGVDPQVISQIKQMTDVIGNNRMYFDDNNLSQVTNAYQQLSQLLNTVKASPEAKARILQDARSKMQEARQSAHGLFHGYGMDKLDAYTGPG